MSAIKYERGASAALVTTVAAPGNASLAAAAQALSTEYDNSVNLHPLADLELACAFSTSPTTGLMIYAYLVPCEDGTTYADGDATVPPASNLLVGMFVLRSINTAQRLVTRGLLGSGIVLPPTKFKIVVLNTTNQSMSASWAMTLYPYRYQAV
jgi:hypothetical protein